MATPIIRSSATISGVITGSDRNDLDIGETVTLTDAQAANSGATYQWTMEDRPIGSSATITNATSAAASFVPDVTGTYRIRCTVNGSAYEVCYLAVPLPVTGARIPSYLEDDTSGGGYNAGGNTKGWHESQTNYMRAVDTALSVATFPGYGVASNMTTIGVGDAAAAGGLATVARADHRHVFPSPTVINDILATSGTLGTSVKAAREDHAHFHGNLTGGSLHALATTSAHGFMSSADKAATILTVVAESSLPNSRRLAAGSNVTFDTTVSGVLTINSTGGGGGGGGYATLQSNATPVTQRTTMNFSTAFSVVDNSGSARTDIDLASASVGFAKLATGTANNVATFDASGVLTGSSGLVWSSGTLSRAAALTLQDSSSGGFAQLILSTAGAGATLQYGAANVTVDGNVNITSTILKIFNSGGTFGGASKAIYVGNRTTAPTSNPTSGFLNWSESGVPKWRDVNGKDYLLFLTGGAKRIPYGNSGATNLTDSADLTYDDTTHDLTLSVAESGGVVGFTVANTSNTASSATNITASVAGSTAADPSLSLAITGGKTWNFVADNANSDRLDIRDSSTSRLQIGASSVLVGNNPTSESFSGLEVQPGPSDANQAAVRVKLATAAGIASTSIYNTNADRLITLASHGSTAAGASNFGSTNASSAVLMVSGSAAAGHFKIGTSYAGDVIMGASNVALLRLTSGGNVSYFSAGSFGSGTGVVFQADATAVPTTNPVSGFISYSEGGVPKWRDSAGNILTIGGTGANSLGTYIVQTATNAPGNAQVLGSLSTGMLKVATTTGVISSFVPTANTIPIGSSSVLVDSTLTLASNLLTHTAASSAGVVGLKLENSSNTASSNAQMTIAVGGSTAANPWILFDIPGGGSNYKWGAGVDNANNDAFTIAPSPTLTALSSSLSAFRVSQSGAISVGVTSPSTGTSGNMFKIAEVAAATTTYASIWNTSTTGVAGYQAATSVSQLDLQAIGTTVSATTYFASTTAQGTIVLQTGGTGPQKIGTTTAADVLFGSNNVERMRITSAGNISIGATQSFGSGTGVVFHADASVVPSTNPTAGFINYSEGGVPKWRDSAGNILTIGGGSGANSLGTYIVQTATNAPANAQVLGSLATGMLKVTTTTGVISSFVPTANTIPLGSGGVLVDSTLTLASNTLTHSAASSAGTVSAVITNSSNTASSHASLAVRAGGSASGDASFILGTGATDWKFTTVNATNDMIQLYKASSMILQFDPSATFNHAQIWPNGSQGVSFAVWNASGNSKAGTTMMGLGFAVGNALSIGPNTGGSGGILVDGIYFDSVAWQRAYTYGHVGTTGTGAFRMVPDGVGNVILGTATSPTSMVGGLLISNGTAPSAAPSSSAAHWVASGVHHFMGTDGVDIIF